MERAQVQSMRRRLLFGSLLSNLGILCAFKYFDFFIVSFQSLSQSLGLSLSLPLLNVILPVGISFYTFQTLSYTIDLYSRKIEKAEQDFLVFACYVALFPQLVAGPIVRAKELLPQLKESHFFDAARVGRGLEMIAWGFFLKVGLADNAAVIVNKQFGIPEAFSSVTHLLGMVCFSFQIYGDFAGYSLIAIGLGRIMGFDFGVNFNRPYFSQNFSEFWQRWHISLSSWLRDYLYIPLGGGRHGTLLTFRNLWITMFLGGLWHGAGWNFVIWGMLHGLYQVIQRLVARPFRSVIRFAHLPKTVGDGIAILTVFLCTTFAWIFFRSGSFGKAFAVIQKIGELDISNLSFDRGFSGAFAKTFFFIFVVLLVDISISVRRLRDLYLGHLWVRLLGIASLFWLILLFGSFEGASFIYFQF